MKKVKALVLRTAGTNCDQETCLALRMAGAEPELIHINRLKEAKGGLNRFHILALPGGFTYGDDVASGKILANEIKSALKARIRSFISEGKLVIGICNGFQVLVKMGLLPGTRGAGKFNVESSLGLNDSGKFMARWVHLKNVHSHLGGERKKNSPLAVWTSGLPEVISLPIAHAEGKFIMRDKDTLNVLEKGEQVVLRYSDPTGTMYDGHFNPNGSENAVAGICDPTGRILGLMPHPERYVSFLQHPNWRRKSCSQEGIPPGLRLFKSGVDFARKHL